MPKLKLLLAIYVASWISTGKLFFLNDLPRESVDYMRLVGEANSGIDMLAGLAFGLFMLFKLLSLIGTLLLLINLFIGKWLFVVSECLSFVAAYFAFIPDFMPRIYSGGFILSVSASFFTMGMIVAILFSSDFKSYTATFRPNKSSHSHP